MKFVEEIVVDAFLPTVRSLLASDLRERGYTQSEVATVLGVSQSAVSKYAHGSVTVNERIASDERIREHVERLGSGLAEDEITPVQALVELEVLIRELEAGGDLLAQLHEEAVPELAEFDRKFRVHDPESTLLTSERVLSSIRRGLRILENTSGFSGLIPAVGSNLVACTPNPQGIDDVAGVPGRIVDVKGSPSIPADPEFGVSEHVATVLLAARDGGADVAAAINIRYDAALIDRLESAGRITAEFDESGDVATSIDTALTARPGATVLYQTGGMGIEPITYVLGVDAESVAETVRSIVD